MDNVITTAQRLIELNLPIIPVCHPDHKHVTEKHKERCHAPGKTPLVAGWQTWSETTNVHLTQWKAQFKQFNIGLVCGTSSGIAAIDVDGQAGVDILMRLSNQDLPTTVEFTTGAGHRLLYRIPKGKTYKKFVEKGPNEHEECAILCEGQYTVMPPSSHPNGTQYEWCEGSEPWTIPIADAPKWLLDLITVEGRPVISRNSTIPGKPAGTPTKTHSRESKFDDLLGPADGADGGDFFLAEDFLNTEVPSTVARNVKSQAAGANKFESTVSPEMLNVPIPEGGRDNTMTQIIGHFCAQKAFREMGKDWFTNHCLEYNRKWCDPPLDDIAIMDKVEKFWGIEEIKTQLYQEKANKPIFNATEMAHKVTTYYANEGTLLSYDSDTGDFYTTTKTQGPWKVVPELYINGLVRKVITHPTLGDESFGNRNKVAEVVAVIKEEACLHFLNRSPFSRNFGPDHDANRYIVFKNGMYDTQLGKLVGWDPNTYIRTSVHHNYEEGADCPHFKKYISDWLPDPEEQRIIQEFIGYCFLPSCLARSALFLIGDGSNGKSMFLHVLYQLFRNNYSSVGYDMMQSDFGLEPMIDKMVNIADDCSLGVRSNKTTEFIKGMISGESILVNRKGRTMLNYRNSTKLIFAANSKPKTTDTSDAAIERYIFITFAQKFEKNAIVANQIELNCMEEIPGIINWALEGLRDLQARGKFQLTANAVYEQKEYKSSLDPVARFIQEACITGKDTKILKAWKPYGEQFKYISNTRIKRTMLFQAFQLWYELETNSPCKMAKKTFMNKIQEKFVCKQGLVNGERQQFYDGLTLNPKYEGIEEISFGTVFKDAVSEYRAKHKNKYRDMNPDEADALIQQEILAEEGEE